MQLRILIFCTIILNIDIENTYPSISKEHKIQLFSLELAIKFRKKAGVFQVRAKTLFCYTLLLCMCIVFINWKSFCFESNISFKCHKKVIPQLYIPFEKNNICQ